MEKGSQDWTRAFIQPELGIDPIVVQHQAFLSNLRPISVAAIYARHHQRSLFGDHWSGHRGPPDIGTGLTGIGLRTVFGAGVVSARNPFERQKPLPVYYKGTQLDCGYRLDFLVAGIVVVEVKAIDALLPIHQAQLLSYLKLGRWKLGLLINFHVPLLREGIKRVVFGLEEPPQSVATSHR